MKGLKIEVVVKEVKAVDGREPTPESSSYGQYVLPEALTFLGLSFQEDLLERRFDWIAVDFVNKDGELIMRMRRAY